MDISLKKRMAEDFWLDKLSELDNNYFCPHFIKDDLTKDSKGDRFETFTMGVSPHSSAKIEAITSGNTSNVFVIFLLILKVVYRKYNEEENGVIITPGILDESNFEDSLLFFCTQIETDKSLAKLAAVTLEELNEAFSFQNYNYDSLLNKLKLKTETTDIDHNIGLYVSDLHQNSTYFSKLKIQLFIHLVDGKYQLQAKYDTKAYGRQFIEQLAVNYLSFIDWAVVNLNSPLDNINYNRSTAYNDAIKGVSNDNPYNNMAVWLKTVANHNKQNVAVVSKNELSYHQLEEKASKLAIFLQEHDVKEDDRIVLILEKSEWVLIAMLASWKIGAGFIPIEPDLPEERRNFILKDAQVSGVITTSEYMFEIESTGFLIAIDLQEAEIMTINEQNLSFDNVQYNGERLAYIIYTSGSTGLPKGCLINHKSLVNYFTWAHDYYLDNTCKGNFAFFTSFAFDLTLTSLFLPLLAGRSLYLFNYSDTSEALNIIFKQDNGVDLVKLTPTHILLLNSLNIKSTSIRKIIVGGEKLTKHHIDILTNINPEILIINEYGPTECTIGTLAEKVDENFISGTIGKPIYNTVAYILDKGHKPVTDYMPGILFLGGNSLSVGYLNNSGCTSDKFIQNPLNNNENLYNTGDHVYRNKEGKVIYLNREDDTIKLNGFRIDLEEISNRIRKNKQVLEALVILHEKYNILIAFICVTEFFDVKQLKEEVAKWLPSFMIPSDYIIIDKIPLLKSGKSDTITLLNKVENRQDRFDKPTTSVQQDLLEIWSDILKRKEIGISDDFFQLGGNSIKGIQIVNRIEQKFGEVLHLAALFESPTIKLLSGKFNNRLSSNNRTIDEEMLVEFRSVIRSLPKKEYLGIKKGRAIFILSPPRSGSTLLRIVLAGHSSLFSPPELELLCYDKLKERSEELTGRLSFFSEGVIRALMEIKKCSADEAKHIMREYEQQGLQVYEFYHIMQEWLDGKTLVDKSPSYSMDLNTLERAEQYFENPLYIHLIRDPYAVINSFEKAHLEQLFKYENRWSPRELAEMTYTISHQNINKFLSDIPDDRKINVKFEDLVDTPSSTVEKICHHFQLPYDNSMVDVYKNVESKMVDGIYEDSRMIGDVKFKDKKQIDHSAATDWKNHLNEGFLGKQALQLMTMHGYNHTNELSAIEEQDYYSLSESQKGLWIIDQMENSGHVYNIPSIYKVRGAIDLAKMEKAFRLLIDRHDSLKTKFINVNNQPKQKIAADLNDFSVQYLSFEGTDAEKKAKDLIQKEINIPFDISTFPLFKVTLIKVGSDEYYLCINTHHIVSDGWSNQVITKGLIQLYHNISDETPDGSILNPLPVQYKDYAAWLHKKLQSDNSSEKYWLNKLDQLPEPLPLTTDFSRRNNKTFNGKVIKNEVGLTLSETITKYADSQGYSLFMLLLAAVKVQMYRYSGQNDFILGTTIASRQNSLLESQVGFYVNTLALRDQILSDDSLKDILKKTKEQTLDAFKHKDYPFGLLVDKLGLSRDTRRSPLFDILVEIIDDNSLENENVVPENVQVRPVGVVSSTSKYDLSFKIRNSKNLILYIEYNSDLFEEWRVRDMIKHLSQILTQIVRNNSEQVSQFTYMTIEEQQLLMEYSNMPIQPEKEYDTSMESELKKIAKINSDKIAVEDKFQAISYSCLNDLSDKLAHYLKSEYGIKEGQLVGIRLERSVDFIICILGVLKTGAGFVPISKDTSEHHLKIIAKDTAMSTLIIDMDYFMKGTYQESSIFVFEMEIELIKNGIKSEFENRVSNPAYVLFTSGTTGDPKGVVISRSNLLSYVEWANQFYFNNTTGNNFGWITSVAFDLSYTAIFTTLLRGDKIYIYDENGPVDNELIAAIEGRYGINTLKLTPSHIELVASLGVQKSTIEYLILGGENLKDAHITAIKNINSGVKIVNEYGPTETTIGSTVKAIGNDDSITIGKPVGNNQVYIVDKMGELLPVGHKGNLIIGGGQVGQGYLNKPELTHQKYTQSRVINQRVYQTGDVAMWLKSGELKLFGRSDRQVKVRGNRLELDAIESVILNASELEGVRVLQSNDNYHTHLCAFVLCSSQGIVNALIEKLPEVLPSYAIPNEFIQLNKFPLTKNGKIDDKKLIQSRVHENDSINGYPKNNLEKELTEIWKSLLVKDKIGTDDNFFHLGGHSLKAAQLVSIIFEKYNISLSLHEIFENGTITQLADVISSTKKEYYTPIPAIEQQEYYNLSAYQLQYWKLSRINPEVFSKTVPALLKINSDYSVFIKAFNLLIKKHEILRTVFIEIDGNPYQKVLTHEECEISPEIIDLTNVTDKNERLKNILKKEKNTPVILSEFPLLKVTVVKWDNSSNYILYKIPHIISDGWSLEVIKRDISYFIHKISEKENAEINLPIQYKEYACWHSKQLGDKRRNYLKQYWYKQLEGVDIKPTFATYDQTRKYKGGIYKFKLGNKVRLDVEQMANDNNMSMYMVMVSIFKVFLSLISNKEDIVIGSAIAGRVHPDLEDLIGPHMNTLALRSTINGDLTFQNVLEAEREVILGALEHQLYPLSKLLEDYSRKLQGKSLFDVGFTFQNHYDRDIQEPLFGEAASIDTAGEVESLHPLWVVATPTIDNMYILIKFDYSIFQEYEIEKMKDIFIALTEKVMDDKNAALKNINIGPHLNPEIEHVNIEIDI